MAAIAGRSSVGAVRTQLASRRSLSHPAGTMLLLSCSESGCPVGALAVRVVCSSTHAMYVLLTFLHVCRRIAQGARGPREFEGARVAAQWLHRYGCMSQHTCVVCFANIFTFAGELPKELGKLVNLETFSVAGNSIGGGLYVPAYMHCHYC